VPTVYNDFSGRPRARFRVVVGSWVSTSCCGPSHLARRPDCPRHVGFVHCENCGLAEADYAEQSPVIEAVSRPPVIVPRRRARNARGAGCQNERNRVGGPTATSLNRQSVSETAQSDALLSRSSQSPVVPRSPSGASRGSGSCPHWARRNVSGWFVILG
jgi:hypothetical protein